MDGREKRWKIKNKIDPRTKRKGRYDWSGKWLGTHRKGGVVFYPTGVFYWLKMIKKMKKKRVNNEYNKIKKYVNILSYNFWICKYWQIWFLSFHFDWHLSKMVYNLYNIYTFVRVIYMHTRIYINNIVQSKKI